MSDLGKATSRGEKRGKVKQRTEKNEEHEDRGITGQREDEAEGWKERISIRAQRLFL